MWVVCGDGAGERVVVVRCELVESWFRWFPGEYDSAQEFAFWGVWSFTWALFRFSLISSFFFVFDICGGCCRSVTELHLLQ